MTTKTASRLLYVSTWLTDFTFMLLVFTISRDLAEKDADLLTMGFVGGMLSLIYAFSGIFLGRLSDRFGRRKFILSGVAGLLVCCFGCLVLEANSWPYLIAYWLAGAALGMIYPALIAWLQQGQHPDHQARHAGRVVLRFCVAWNLGLISGQLTGGFLFDLGRHVPIVLAMLLSAANLVMILLTGRTSSRPAPHASPPQEHHLQRQALTAGFAKLNWIANLGTAFSMSMIFHLFPKLAVNLEIAPETHGTVLAVMRVTVIATYLLLYLSNFWHLRFDVPLIAQGLGIIGLAALAVAHGVTQVTMGLMAFAVLVGYNYFAGLFYSTTSRGDEKQGWVSGMHEGTLAVGFTGGSMGGGLVGVYGGPGAPYLLGIAVIVVMVAVQIVIYLREVRPMHRKTVLQPLPPACPD
ncbi:MAG: MFS transporter [Phycisphaerae bacterium]|nr:MFS transporter [Phycisphaerae bacterium]